MNLQKFAMAETATLHLRDAADELMYADGTDGQPDLSKPIRVVLFGPGSRVHAKAKAAASNRMMDRFKKKGKTDVSADEQRAETAEFLAACTHSMENIEHEGLSGPELFKAIYNQLPLIFIAQQVDKFLGDTANFTKASAKN